jgi:hypothetical protein
MLVRAYRQRLGKRRSLNECPASSYNSEAWYLHPAPSDLPLVTYLHLDLRRGFPSCSDFVGSSSRLARFTSLQVEDSGLPGVEEFCKRCLARCPTPLPSSSHLNDHSQDSVRDGRHPRKLVGGRGAERRGAVRTTGIARRLARCWPSPPSSRTVSRLAEKQRLNDQRSRERARNSRREQPDSLFTDDSRRTK